MQGQLQGIVSPGASVKVFFFFSHPPSPGLWLHDIPRYSSAIGWRVFVLCACMCLLAPSWISGGKSHTVYGLWAETCLGIFLRTQGRKTFGPLAEPQMSFSYRDRLVIVTATAALWKVTSIKKTGSNLLDISACPGIEERSWTWG